MKVLINYFNVAGTSSYPDEYTLFSNMEKVLFNNQEFWLCDYKGSKSIASSETEAYLASIEPKPEQQAPVVALTNVSVTGQHVVLGIGDIWWLPKNSSFTITANAALADMDMMIIIERVISGGIVIDDLRIKANIENGVITVNGLFAMSGNYQITSERLNKGLETIGAPFRLAFDKVEFDAHV